MNFAMTTSEAKIPFATGAMTYAKSLLKQGILCLPFTLQHTLF